MALLRGINVGGRNKVPMADLRAAFDAGGYGAVETYIQSGNVLFATAARRDSIETDIEAMLERHFGIPLVVVVRSHRQLARVVSGAPPGFGDAPEERLSDVVFLKAPLTVAQAMRVVELRDGVDRAWPGTGAIYFDRLSARRTQSRLSRIASTPEYQRMTIRNWNTTTRLSTLVASTKEAT